MNAVAMNSVLRKGSLRNRICQRPITLQDLGKMMAKFETKSLLSVAPGRGRKLASVKTKEIVELSKKETEMESTHGTYSIFAVALRIEYCVQNCP